MLASMSRCFTQDGQLALHLGKTSGLAQGTAAAVPACQTWTGYLSGDHTCSHLLTPAHASTTSWQPLQCSRPAANLPAGLSNWDSEELSNQGQLLSAHKCHLYSTMAAPALQRTSCQSASWPV